MLKNISGFRLISNSKAGVSLLLFFILSVCFAQTDASFSGRVISGDTGVKDVFVINRKTGAEAKTDSNGHFSIAAKVGDILVVHSAGVVERQFAINEDSFKNMPYVMSVNYRALELEELVITKNNKLDSESLGLVPKGQKKYTRQEKKLYTATHNKPLWVLPLGLLAGSMPLDPFINAISGRTKKIKTDLANEKKLIAFQKISNFYTDEELTGQLKIPEGYTKGFMFYATEDDAIVQALDTKTDADIKFMLTALALKYNRIITDE